jgi:hypothetical protein
MHSVAWIHLVMESVGALVRLFLNYTLSYCFYFCSSVEPFYDMVGKSGEASVYVGGGIDFGFATCWSLIRTFLLIIYFAYFCLQIHVFG